MPLKVIRQLMQHRGVFCTHDDGRSLRGRWRSRRWHAQWFDRRELSGFHSVERTAVGWRSRCLRGCSSSGTAAPTNRLALKWAASRRASADCLLVLRHFARPRFEAGELFQESQRHVADRAVTLLGDDQRRLAFRRLSAPRRCRRNIPRARAGRRDRRPARCCPIRANRSAAAGPWLRRCGLPDFG